MSDLPFIETDRDIDKHTFYGKRIVDLSHDDLLKLCSWLGKENQRLTNELYDRDDRRASVLEEK